MAQRGKPSIAHEYDARGQCIYCSMYKNNVESLVHVCKQFREDLVDKREADKLKMDLDHYRTGISPEQRAGKVPLSSEMQRG